MPAMRIVTWNVNSIRSRQPQVLAWIERYEPDVILLQETKCNDLTFDEPRLISAHCGGVRVHSVYVPNGRKLKDPHWYFKLDWLRMLSAAVDVSESSIVAGDFNVQPTELDVYDPKAWKNRNHGSPPEREAIAKLIQRGLRDVTREYLPDPGVYTWWNYRPGQFEKNKGMRIDLALCTDDIADRVSDVWIDREERASASTSDHAPLVLDLALRRQR